MFYINKLFYLNEEMNLCLFATVVQGFKWSMEWHATLKITHSKLFNISIQYYKLLRWSEEN